MRCTETLALSSPCDTRLTDHLYLGKKPLIPSSVAAML